MVDISKIRVGDEITVRMTVTDLDINEAKRPIGSTGAGGYLGCPCYWPPAECIVGHVSAPRPIVVGSRVTHSLWDSVGKVLALYKESAWVKWAEDARSPVTSDVANLKLVDEEPSA